MNQNTNIRLMEPEDFRVINQWCIDEGWNLGRDDSDTFYKIDPQGHFIMKKKEAIASLSLVKHTPLFFTLGPFIVKKEYRKRGIGETLWNHAMSRMNQELPEALIALYAVPAQVSRYQKSGFTPLFTNQRWYLESRTQNKADDTSYCHPLNLKLIPAVSVYDSKNYIASREFLLTEMLKKPNVNGFIFIDDNTIKGFGIIRPCVRGFRIGPLVADTQEIAQSLINSLLKLSNQESVFLDVPECNQEALALLRLNGLRKTEEDTITMIKGSRPTSYIKNWERQYGLFSLEIG